MTAYPDTNVVHSSWSARLASASIFWGGGNCRVCQLTEQHAYHEKHHNGIPLCVVHVITTLFCRHPKKCSSVLLAMHRHNSNPPSPPLPPTLRFPAYTTEHAHQAPSFLLLVETERNT